MKKPLLLLSSILLILACEKSELSQDQQINGTSLKGDMEKSIVCHYDSETDEYQTLYLPPKAIEAHLAHGDYLGECVERTYVPDDFFEQKLIELGYDDVLDNYVVTQNISGIKTLRLGTTQVSDLTGIEDFSELEFFQIESYDLTSIDVTNNIHLTYLRVDAPITSIDLSSNLNLENFSSNFNHLSALDVTSNTKLKYLGTFSNPGDSSIANIDLSNNPELIALTVGGTLIESIDLSNNTKLENLNLLLNQLSSLDITMLLNLTRLNVSLNNLVSLEFPENSLIDNLTLRGNQLTAIDLTGLSQLTYLYIQENPLTCIQVSQDQLNDIPTTWYTDTDDEYSLDCGY